MFHVSAKLLSEKEDLHTAEIFEILCLFPKLPEEETENLFEEEQTAITCKKEF
jgi:U3 small nucleolar RNA-associated protein 19